MVRTALDKEPDDRYPTCTALISAAEQALGFGRSTPLHRRKSVLLVATIVLMVLAAASVAAVLATNGHRKVTVAPLFARADSLARIDPATNKVSAVIDAGLNPVVAAAGGHSVWVYNKDGPTISEVDARTNRVLKTTTISGPTPAQCCSLFTGPVLAADASGAWFVNGGAYHEARGVLCLVPGTTGTKPPREHVKSGCLQPKRDSALAPTVGTKCRRSLRLSESDAQTTAPTARRR